MIEKGSEGFPSGPFVFSGISGDMESSMVIMVYVLYVAYSSLLSTFVTYQTGCHKFVERYSGILELEKNLIDQVLQSGR